MTYDRTQEFLAVAYRSKFQVHNKWFKSDQLNEDISDHKEARCKCPEDVMKRYKEVGLSSKERRQIKVVISSFLFVIATTR